MEIEAKKKNGQMARCPYKRRFTQPFFNGIPFVGRDACMNCIYFVKVVQWLPMRIECSYKEKRK